MDSVACGSAEVTERLERAALGYRQFRCWTCGKQFNERSGTLLNHTQYGTVKLRGLGGPAPVG